MEFKKNCLVNFGWFFLTTVRDETILRVIDYMGAIFLHTNVYPVTHLKLVIL